ncbi:hypothetical protein KQI84_00495 [bacterium]|nr:hypothetical protein [bacterium]
MRRFGFTGSAWLRVLGVAAYAAIASIAVWAVESKSVATSPEPTAKTPSAIRLIHIEAESTFAVSEWTVTLDGKPIAADSTSESTWTGAVKVAPNAQLLVEARSDDFFSDFGQAVHLRIEQDGHATEETHWGKGEITILRKVGTEVAPDE